MKNESQSFETYDRDFRLYLQRELIRRCEDNPQYSLRAFAKQLGVNSAIISTLLSRKRKMTEQTVKRLGLALQLGPAEINRFVIHLQKKRGVKPSAANVAGPRSYHEVTQDTFVAISDWYHDAILELTHLKTFRPDVRWIANVLDISVTEVNAAVERLERLELLTIDKKGRWKDIHRSNSNTLDMNFTSMAMRKYQKKILEKSIAALENLPRTERDHTSIMIAANSKDLDKVKEMVRDFRHQLAAFLQRDGAQPDEVYQVAVGVFPLSRARHNENKKLNKSGEEK